jgi:hypothetical protein
LGRQKGGKRGVECWIDHEVGGGDPIKKNDGRECKEWHAKHAATPMVERTWFRVLFRSAKWRC